MIAISANGGYVNMSIITGVSMTINPIHLPYLLGVTGTVLGAISVALYNVHIKKMEIKAARVAKREENEREDRLKSQERIESILATLYALMHHFSISTMQSIALSTNQIEDLTNRTKAGLDGIHVMLASRHCTDDELKWLLKDLRTELINYCDTLTTKALHYSNGNSNGASDQLSIACSQMGTAKGKIKLLIEKFERMQKQ